MDDCFLNLIYIMKKNILLLSFLCNFSLLLSAQTNVEKGLQSIEGVIKTYFQHGGEHIQINVVDTKTLKDAQVNPEKYKGLMVRVAGYMAYFTELDKSAQDTIIYRTAHFEQAE